MSLPKGWSRGGKYWLVHDSGKWRISKASVREQFSYTLWKHIPGRGDDTSRWGLYSNHDSVAEAANAMKTKSAHRLNQTGVEA
jgi:hypothetical protein